MALQKTPTWAASSVTSWSESSSPLTRQRTAAGKRQEMRRRCSWRPRPRGGLDQALTVPRPSRRHSGLAGPSIPLNAAPSRHGSQIFSLLRKLTCPRTLWQQRNRGCDCKDGGRALRLRSSGRRSTASGSPPSRRRAAKEARRSWLQRRCGMDVRRRTMVLATGASSSSLRAWGSACSFSVPRRLANLQHDWPVANLPGTAAHHRWRLPGGAQAAPG